MPKIKYFVIKIKGACSIPMCRVRAANKKDGRNCKRIY